MAQVSQLNIRRGELIPDLTLQDGDRHQVSTRDFYLRRNLVLAVLPKTPEPDWSAWVEQLGRAAGRIPEGDAAVLVVVPDEMDARLRETIGHVPESVVALIDEREIARTRFGAPGDQGLLVVVDRYGVAFVIETGGPDDDAMDPGAIPGWVEFIACQCS